MILGTGVDITEVNRLKKAIEKWGESFLEGFTREELNNAKSRLVYTNIWQVDLPLKRRSLKLRDESLSWKDLEVLNDKDGKPFCKFLNSKGKGVGVVVSISHVKLCGCQCDYYKGRLIVIKRSFGHIFILAGSARYSGAAALCSLAVLRSGAGLVTLGLPKGINNAMIKLKPKEAITLPLPQTKEGGVSLLAFKKIADFIKKIDILAIGPGLGDNPSTYSLIRKVIFSSLKPMVIDADGLNAIKGNLNTLSKLTKKNPKVIMTPHPKEMSRLTGLNVEEVQKNRKKISLDFAKRYRVTLVLKGYETIVQTLMKILYK